MRENAEVRENFVLVNSANCHNVEVAQLEDKIDSEEKVMSKESEATQKRENKKNSYMHIREHSGKDVGKGRKGNTFYG